MMENGLTVHKNTGVAEFDPEKSLKLISIADQLYKSNLFPNTKNPAGAYAVIQFGIELGVPPMTALQNINIIEGKPAANAQLIASLLMRAGVSIELLESTDKKCRVKMRSGESSVEDQYTIEEAQKAGLTGKKNWTAYAKDMLYWRAVCRVGRRIRPDVILGLYSVDEISGGEYRSTEEVIRDVTPEPEQTPQQTVSHFPTDGTLTLKKRFSAVCSQISEQVFNAIGNLWGDPDAYESDVNNFLGGRICESTVKKMEAKPDALAEKFIEWKKAGGAV